ncbi:hypothetical protein K1719_023652 [Acacia pycnantha]|nr:hypothetical protein K1719_023652 [Acacia pycnantha]
MKNNMAGLVGNQGCHDNPLPKFIDMTDPERYGGRASMSASRKVTDSVLITVADDGGLEMFFTLSSSCGHLLFFPWFRANGI